MPHQMNLRSDGWPSWDERLQFISAGVKLAATPGQAVTRSRRSMQPNEGRCWV